MPIYEYRCASCGFQKEYLQKVNSPLLTECPQCGKATFSKMVTAAGFQLKGSGWYATDFKNGGAKPAVNADANKSEPGEHSQAAQSADDANGEAGKAKERADNAPTNKDPKEAKERKPSESKTGEAQPSASKTEVPTKAPGKPAPASPSSGTSA